MLNERSQLSRFLIVGVTAAGLLYIAVFALATLGLDRRASAFLGYLIVVPVAYLCQYHWAFKSRRPHAAALPSYVAVQVLVAAATALAVEASPDRFAAPWLVAGVTTVLGSAFSFLASRYWVFHRS